MGILAGRYSNWIISISFFYSMKTLYKKLTGCLLHYFRFDLQLHFFWSFFLTMSAIYWQPMIYSGIIATIIKEGLDLWSKGKWNWDDFWFGTVGWICGVIFLWNPYLTLIFL